MAWMWFFVLVLSPAAAWGQSDTASALQAFQVVAWAVEWGFKLTLIIVFLVMASNISKIRRRLESLERTEPEK